DVVVLPRLADAFDKKVRKAGLQRAAELEMRALPAVAWLSCSGVALDSAAWLALADQVAREVEALQGRLDAAAPTRPGRLPGMDGWNWKSAADLGEALGLFGLTVEATDDDTLASLDYPFAEVARSYRSASKLISTYGANWLKGALHAGRLYAEWR